MSRLLSFLQSAIDKTGSYAFVVAFSGGLDSSTLLHATRQILSSGQAKLRAIHVNHGIEADADQWQEHCLAFCARGNIALHCERLALGPDSSEEQARSARYRVFEQQLAHGEVLLMAQHLDDQLETLLLRLLRGSGAAGLGGMPEQRQLGRGSLLRPWLELPRRELEDYARAQGLEWIEDQSNADSRYDRNYCRLEVLPKIEQRWPNYRDSWHKSQQLLAESGQLLEDLAAIDLERVTGSRAGILQRQPLMALSGARQRNLLRYWLQQVLGVAQVDWQMLRQLSEEVLPASIDNGSAMDLGDCYLQVFQDQLFALRQLPFDGHAQLHWNAVHQPRLKLPGNGELSARAAEGEGLGRVHADNLEVRYRQGGESLRLPGRPEKSLKKLFQEQGVPPWYRQRLPLLYQDQRLVYVPGLGAAVDCKATPDEGGLHIHWQHPEFLVAGGHHKFAGE